MPSYIPGNVYTIENGTTTLTIYQGIDDGFHIFYTYDTGDEYQIHDRNINNGSWIISEVSANNSNDNSTPTTPYKKRGGANLRYKKTP